MGAYVSEALEKQYETMDFLKTMIKNPSLRPGVTHAETVMWSTDVHALRLGKPFYWHDRTVEIVASTMKDFNLDEITASRNLFVEDVGFCWFPTRAPFEIESYDTKRLFPVKAISWYCFGHEGIPYVGCTAYTQYSINRSTGLPFGFIQPVIWACVRMGDPMSHTIDKDHLNFQGYQDDRTLQETLWLRQFIVAANTFFRQDFLVTSQEPLERHARKRLGKKSDEFPLIRVVQLRKTPSKKSEGVGEAKDHDYQWWVGQHVRKQWYASLGEHLPIVILPYLKGPEDKPIKPRTTPIFNVSR